MITTIGTLVVAVSGFYFGTSSVAAARGVAAPLLPVICDIDPKSGSPGQELDLKIIGKNFRAPKVIQLTRDSNQIDGTSILSSDTEIRCKIKIPSDAEVNTAWDVLVVNEDGGEDKLPRIFLVTAPPSDAANESEIAGM